MMGSLLFAFAIFGMVAAALIILAVITLGAMAVINWLLWGE